MLRVHIERFLPNRHASDNSTRNEHRDILRGSLDDAADSDEYSGKLHEAESTQLVCDKNLNDSTYGFTSDVTRYAL